MSRAGAAGRVLRVRVVQVAYDDRESVTDRVHRVADLVRGQRDADLIVLPELWAPGYFTFAEWSERAELLDGPTVSLLAEAAAQVGAFVHAGSILERAAEGRPRSGEPGSRRLWNTSIVLGRDGSCIAQYRKIHPFGFGEGEPTLIDPGTSISTALLGHEHDPGGITLGLATCYDLRFPELFRQLAAVGSTIFAIPAAWPAARREHWEVLGRARAIENQAFVIQCNTGGTHGGVELGGHSQVISPRGEVLARAGAGEEVLTVDIDLDELEDYRQAFPVLADRRL
ncbi:carbon-nitrogen family hydrolase [Nakamurella leprariae]|uniref:Carbon-nitrogen family hydrolase n=1 Tax=Nakamurella leprariae TaxID=2803911 RepID=A0A938YG00_9ACTN|nr:carbon-nitrogen family hydrolase [Nakamurella leprariae]MBM9468883.1 carbon-nitrogen family hydrolase [Nakamurella leprariae]